MKKMEAILSEYFQCINRIDDYLEYKYKAHNIDQMKACIITEIDLLTENLKNIKDGK